MSRKSHVPSSAASSGDSGIVRAASDALAAREAAELKAAQGSRGARGCAAVVSTMLMLLGIALGAGAVLSLPTSPSAFVGLLLVAMPFASGGLYLTMKWMRGVSPVGDVPSSLPASMADDVRSTARVLPDAASPSSSEDAPDVATSPAQASSSTER